MPDELSHQEMLIVTGMSGAGRSTVANALEDLGWYVVDNLPTPMLKPLVELAQRAGSSLPRIAAVVDVRGGDLFSDVQETFDALRSSTIMRVLFLDATDIALVRRFEQVRRPHPLQGDGTPLDGISEERSRMAGLRATSDVVIDTSALNIHQLTTLIANTFSSDDAVGLKITLQSFGFKYGLPADADMMTDCRFLPNPFWIPDLKALNGMDRAVRDYVLSQEGAQDFITRYSRALEPVFAGFQRENKRHATIAIGCTGGKHRSVAVAEELAKLLGGLPGVAVSVRHRDVTRE